MVGAIYPQLKLIENPAPTALSAEDRRAKWDAEYKAKNPTLMPQQAFASNAELGPPSGTGRADDQASKIHTEIATEYRFLTEELMSSFEADRKVGPELGGPGTRSDGRFRKRRPAP
jgi:hypothetical protein